MVIHKNTRLTPIQRKALADDYLRNHIRKCDLIRKYQVSAPTVNKIISRARDKDYSVHKALISDSGAWNTDSSDLVR